MKYACFAKLKDLEKVADAGFDGVELDSNELRKLNDEEISALKTRLDHLKLEVCAFSWLLPNTVSIWAPEFPREQWLEQFVVDGKRMSSLSCGIVVLAGGPIRCVGNDNYTQEKKEKINRFIQETAKVFQSNGVKVALETVCFDYTDYLMSLKESAELCARSGSENLYLVTDIRHLIRAGDDPESILAYQDRIIHAHIDNPIPVKRVMPLPNDGYSYDCFLKRVVKTKTEWLSYEVHDEGKFEENAPTSLGYIKELISNINQ